MSIEKNAQVQKEGEPFLLHDVLEPSGVKAKMVKQFQKGLVQATAVIREQNQSILRQHQIASKSPKFPQSP